MFFLIVPGVTLVRPGSSVRGSSRRAGGGLGKEKDRGDVEQINVELKGALLTPRTDLKKHVLNKSWFL